MTRSPKTLSKGTSLPPPKSENQLPLSPDDEDLKYDSPSGQKSNIYKLEAEIKTTGFLFRNVCSSFTPSLDLRVVGEERRGREAKKYI